MAPKCAGTLGLRFPKSVSIEDQHSIILGNDSFFVLSEEKKWCLYQWVEKTLVTQIAICPFHCFQRKHHQASKGKTTSHLQSLIRFPQTPRRAGQPSHHRGYELRLVAELARTVEACSLRMGYMVASLLKSERGFPALNWSFSVLRALVRCFFSTGAEQLS
jgi:hypothetical protein